MTQTPILFVNALVIPVAGGRAWFRGWLATAADGTIAGLGEGEAPQSAVDVADEVRDLDGAFLAPGFVSAHSHLFTSGMRGLTPDSTLYPWVQRQSEFIAKADADDVYWFTLHGCLDFLQAGVTSAYNFTDSRIVARYEPATDTRALLNVRPLEYLHRQIDAARDAGLRSMTSIRLDPDVQTVPEAYENFARSVRYLGETVPDDLTLGASVFGAVQWSSDPEQAVHEVAMMDAHGIGAQAHLLETAEMLEQQKAKVAWYDAAGALRPGFLFGHFVHADEATVELVASRGAGMVWQPTSNGRLGSGIADVPAYLSSGMPVGMGLDDQSCTDIADPFQNMRIGAYALRAAASDAGAMSAAEVLRLHTLASAQVLGAGDRIGSLEVGKLADLLVVDPRRPDTGPIWDPVAHYVFAMGQRNLRSVYVNGRLVVDDGEHLSPLAAQASVELHARAAAIGRALGLAPA